MFLVFIGYLQFFEKIDRFCNLIPHIYTYVHTLEISGRHKSNFETHYGNLIIGRLKGHFMCELNLKVLNEEFVSMPADETSSLRLLRLARESLQIIKYFSHKHKLQRFEVLL